MSSARGGEDVVVEGGAVVVNRSQDVASQESSNPRETVSYVDVTCESTADRNVPVAHVPNVENYVPNHPLTAFFRPYGCPRARSFHRTH